MPVDTSCSGIESWATEKVCVCGGKRHRNIILESHNETFIALSGEFV